MKKGLKTGIAFLLTLFALTSGTAAYAKQYDIRDFGAVGDGTTVNTASVQKAIDRCNAEGGGVVLVQDGTYVTGTIFLKSGVTLRVERMATLLGSPDIADYQAEGVLGNMYRDEPYMDRCLIFARGQQFIGIEGGGTIDGNGAAFPNAGDRVNYRPMLFRIVECEHIRMRDVVLQNPGGWTTAWLYCNDIVVDGISVFARVRGNGDGLDFDSCQNVRVSNCMFDTSDDSICLQASRKDLPCKNVTIINCQFCSRWAGIRIGLLSRANFENVLVTSCLFRDITDSGLKIQMNEGAVMKNMVFSDLLMVGVPRPIFMTHCSLRAYVNGEEEYPAMQTIGDMTFHNIRIDNSGLDKHSAIIMTGIPGNDIQNISLSNITMISAGGGTPEDAAVVCNEFTETYFRSLPQRRWPEYSGLGGMVPSSALYLRHMNNVTLDNVRVNVLGEDARPQLTATDVKDLALDGKPVTQERIAKLSDF